MKKDSAILVCGHTGLIGSALLRLLKKEGYRQVRTASRADVDFRDAEATSAFFQEARPEYVFLAAGRVGGIAENQAHPADLMTENLSIQLNAVSGARQNGAAKLVFFGSSCMYPRECAQPMSEDLLLSGRPEPTSLPYAVSKLAGTYLCLAHNQQSKENRFLVVVPNNTYGPGDDFDPRSAHVLSSLLARFHEAKLAGIPRVTLWGSGSPVREFVHADDVASACLLLLRRDASGDRPWNIGTGSGISIKDLASHVSAAVGYMGRIEWDAARPDGAPRKVLDSSKLRALGWKPRICLEDGLRETYRWYRSNVARKAS